MTQNLLILFWLIPIAILYIVDFIILTRLVYEQISIIEFVIILVLTILLTEYFCLIYKAPMLIQIIVWIYINYIISKYYHHIQNQEMDN
jgi:hypothetical protein